MVGSERMPRTCERELQDAVGAVHLGQQALRHGYLVVADEVVGDADTVGQVRLAAEADRARGIGADLVLRPGFDGGSGSALSVGSFPTLSPGSVAAASCAGGNACAISALSAGSSVVWRYAMIWPASPGSAASSARSPAAPPAR